MASPQKDSPGREKLKTTGAEEKESAGILSEAAERDEAEWSEPSDPPGRREEAERPE